MFRTWRAPLLGGLVGLPLGVPRLGAATGGVVGGLIDWMKGAPGAQGASASNTPVQMEGVLMVDGDKLGKFVGNTVGKFSDRAPTGPAWFDPTMSPTPNDAAFAHP
jgi:hypothetical protein